VTPRRRFSRLARTICVVAIASTAVVALGAQTGASSPNKTLRLAYLSYAVANPYDAPMLAAARTAASARGAKITAIFDANNDPNTQFAQLQNVIALGKKRFDGVIIQPIYGAGLIKLVKQAVAKGLKVGNIDQTMGTRFSTAKKQVPGLAANVIFVPTELGTKLGTLTVKACNKLGKSSCQVGYIYGFKGYNPDTPVRSAFDKAIAAGNNIQVVAEGQGFFSAEGGLAASQTILQAHPDLDVLVAPDQSLTGAQGPIAAAGRKDLLTVGWGGSSLAFQRLKAGTEYGSVIQLPATEGEIGVADVIKAIRTGKNAPGRDVRASLPNGGMVTKANVKKFTPEFYS
jgi:ribose transport system substrate-binding protein